MAGTPTTSSAEHIIALCEQGIYEPCEGSEPLDLLARGMLEIAAGDLETAKDLLSTAYWSLDGEWKDKAGVQLSVAYWAAGEKSEARALLDTMPPGVDALLVQAIIETDSDPNRALETLERAEHYSASRYKKGRLHNQRGLCFRKLRRYDEAVREYAFALELFDDCPLRAIVENNLGGVLEETGNMPASHEKIDVAIAELSGANLGKAYDQKARAFLSDGDPGNAEIYARCAVSLLESQDRRGWLVEALLTRAEVFSSQRLFNAALNDLFHAHEIAEYVNDKDLLIITSRRLALTARSLSRFYHARSVRLALDDTDSLNGAARKLGISRPALQEFMRTHNLTYKPQRRRSIITKS